ncbi:MAG TPA: kelch repeat-containing protein [Candidatus Limnocylindria bacterium]
MTRARALAVLSGIFSVGIAVGLALSGLRAPEAVPQWHETTALSASRTYAQAIGLATGEVLVVGGMDRDPATRTYSHAEIIDPRTGSTTPDPAARIARMWQTLTTLRSDLVLVVDGTERLPDGWHALAYAETFDPWSHTWRTVRAPTYARSDHSAVLLNDGRVLVIGGNDGPKWITPSEIYDPLTDRWSKAAPLPVGRTRFTAVTLPDGRVLVAGGLLQPGPATDTTLMYDPATDAWSDGPRMRARRAIYAAVTLPNRDVLFIGGQEDGSNSAERYDVRTQEFVYAGTLASPRMYGQAAVLDDGTVVYAGGIGIPARGFATTTDVERWDPRTNLWTASAPLNVGRAGGAVVAIAGGVYLIGGSADLDRPISSVELLR